MLNTRQSGFQKESDLLKIYREASEGAKYIRDTDEKLLSYSKVIDFCVHSDRCLQSESSKKYQILFWTYSQMAELFLQKDLDTFDVQNKINALEAYHKALEFCLSDEQSFEVLSKMHNIYLSLEDKKNVFQTSVEMAQILDDGLKIETFLRLADETSNAKEEAYFLEQALRFVTKERISALEKCENVFEICKRLLKIYEKAQRRADIKRIETIEHQFEKTLNN